MFKEVKNSEQVSNFSLSDEVLNSFEELIKSHNIDSARRKEIMSLFHATMRDELTIDDIPDLVSQAFGFDQDQARVFTRDFIGHLLLPLENYIPEVKDYLQKYGGNPADYSDFRIEKEKANSDEVMKDILSEKGVELPQDLFQRLVFLTDAYISGRRNREDTKQLLMRGSHIGGLDIKAEPAEELLKAIDSRINPHSSIASNESETSPQIETAEPEPEPEPEQEPSLPSKLSKDSPDPNRHSERSEESPQQSGVKEPTPSSKIEDSKSPQQDEPESEESPSTTRHPEAQPKDPLGGEYHNRSNSEHSEEITQLNETQTQNLEQTFDNYSREPINSTESSPAPRHPERSEGSPRPETNNNPEVDQIEGATKQNNGEKNDSDFIDDEDDFAFDEFEDEEMKARILAKINNSLKEIDTQQDEPESESSPALRHPEVLAEESPQQDEPESEESPSTTRHPEAQPKDPLGGEYHNRSNSEHSEESSQTTETKETTHPELLPTISPSHDLTTTVPVSAGDILNEEDKDELSEHHKKTQKIQKRAGIDSDSKQNAISPAGQMIEKFWPQVENEKITKKDFTSIIESGIKGLRDGRQLFNTLTESRGVDLEVAEKIVQAINSERDQQLTTQKQAFKEKHLNSRATDSPETDYYSEKDESEPAPPPKAKAELSNPSIHPSRHGEQKVTDIIYKKELHGPIDELRVMKLTDFRRLAPRPEDITDHIIEKIKFISEDGYDSHIQAIEAWKQSPVYKLYLSIVMDAVKNQNSISETSAKWRERGEEVLNPAEIQAINQLQKQLKL